MARAVTAISVTVLPQGAGLVAADRLHTWLVGAAAFGATAWVEAAGAVHAACALARPQRLARLKQAIRAAAACDAGDVLHVAAAEDARQACARVIDAAGGLAYSAPSPVAAVPRGPTERAAVAMAPHALQLHGLTVGDVLAGRAALWSHQRAAGVLRPLPLSRALEAVAPRVDASCMLPVHHACESPAALAERFVLPEALACVPRHMWDYTPTPRCPLCWRNENLPVELRPGHVRAAIPRLYAAGYDAGHLLLRHAEHALARAATDVVRERRRAVARVTRTSDTHK